MTLFEKDTVEPFFFTMLVRYMTIQRRIDNALYCKANRELIIDDAKKDIMNWTFKGGDKVGFAREQQTTLNEYTKKLDSKIDKAPLHTQELEKVRLDLISLYKLRKNLSLTIDDVERIKANSFLKSFHGQVAVTEAPNSLNESTITNETISSWFSYSAKKKIKNCQSVQMLVNTIDDIQVIKKQETRRKPLSFLSNQYYFLPTLKESIKNYKECRRIQKDCSKILEEIPKAFGIRERLVVAYDMELQKRIQISRGYNYIYNNALTGSTSTQLDVHQASSESIFFLTLVRYQWIEKQLEKAKEMETNKDKIIQEFERQLPELFGDPQELLKAKEQEVEEEIQKIEVYSAELIKLSENLISLSRTQESLSDNEKSYSTVDSQQAKAWFEKYAKQLLEQCRTKKDLRKAIRTIQLFQGSKELFLAKEVERLVFSFINHHLALKGFRWPYSRSTGPKVSEITGALGLRATTLRVLDETFKAYRLRKENQLFTDDSSYETTEQIAPSLGPI